MSEITVIISASAIPSNPSTAIFDQTLKSVRDRLPDSEIIVCFDGLSASNMELKTQYHQATQATIHKINFELDNVFPIIFQEHKHQTGMTREALKLVRTPLLLFVEQDAPLHGEIPFDEISEVIKSGYANLIRFSHEAQVHPEHKHLMIDQEPIEILGVPLLRTIQWSQRPSLASTEFYRLLSKYWDEQPRFIEHVLYGLALVGDPAWWRLHLYAPEGSHVRSLHLDGRHYVESDA